mmetsp:Transcript_3012/g.12463  ORF Transcript_3012/g.12463 Transcript_3012/m.12463 type:complete len:435 (+) Transcript_3012:1676-2980(+)
MNVAANATRAASKSFVLKKSRPVFPETNASRVNRESAKNTASRTESTSDRVADAAHVPATSATSRLPSSDANAAKTRGAASFTSADVNNAAASAAESGERARRIGRRRADVWKTRAGPGCGEPDADAADGGDESASRAKTSRGESGNKSLADRLVPVPKTPSPSVSVDAASSPPPAARCCARRLFAAAAGLTASTTVRTASPVTRPAMSPNASRLLAASAAAKKSSNVLLPAVLSRYVPTICDTNVEQTSKSTDRPSSLAATRSALASADSSAPSERESPSRSTPFPRVAAADSRHTSMMVSSVCLVAPPTTTETTPQFRGSSSLSTTRSAADGPAFASPASPPITAEAAPATPLATPLETRAAHSSSSGVFTSRTACLMESGMGASGSASMNAAASVVSLEMSSDAASAALVYPSVAVASWRARSDCDTRWIA